jgi:CBS domain containing-hemolysin-like protein
VLVCREVISPAVYVAMGASVLVAFWSSLVEATYLTLRPFSLGSSIDGGSARAAKALSIVNEKTRLVSVTTFLDTIANVVLASSMGLILSDYFGPVGWVYSAVVGSLAIMVFLYLLPKAIGIENALRMSIALATGTKVVMDTLSPIAVPLTTISRGLSERLVGKPGYREVDLVDEFEDVVAMLERAGHIEPDAGRLLRTALVSSKSTAGDSITPATEIVSVGSTATVLDALKAMGRNDHPRIPVYDERRDTYIGTVTFRTISKAIARDHLDASVLDYMVQPARVGSDDRLASVMEKMQDAGTTIAFVFDGTHLTGMITLSDIIERILGVKV